MDESAGITVDVRAFAPVSAIDTCSIWNLLSSPRLLGAALRKGRWFVVARYVKFEALEKPRTRPTIPELAMQNEFRRRLAAQEGFSEEPIALADLLAVADLPEAQKLGRGEVAALALARKLRSAVLTEDRAARKAAPRVGVAPAQTTPQLLGWLLYEGELTDMDVSTVITEHEQRIESNRGRLTVYLQRIYIEACRCRLLRASADVHPDPPRKTRPVRRPGCRIRHHGEMTPPQIGSPDSYAATDALYEQQMRKPGRPAPNRQRENSVDKKTTGAWIVHHGRKIAADMRGGAEFSALDLAAKAAGLLARLGESDQATLSSEQVDAAARIGNLNPKTELRACLEHLQNRKLIDRSTGGAVSVLE